MLFRNTLAQTTSTLIGYLFSFILAPVMINRLGLDQFGVWAVTGAFASYAGLLDLGVGRSLTRFIAIYDAEDEAGKIRECIGLGLLVVSVVGIVALAIVAAAAGLLHDQLGVISTGEMRTVAMSSVAIWTLGGYFGVLNAVGIGRREMVAPNVAILVGSLINFIFSIVALLLSPHLAPYAAANAAASVVALVPGYLALRRVWEAPYASIPSRELCREVIGFSLKNQVGWLAELVNFQTDKVVIAVTVDVHAAAIYEIASRVVMGVRSAAILSVSAMIPTAAARIASEGGHVVLEMFHRYTQRSCSVSFPLFIAASVSAPFLLVAWLGDAPGESALLVPLLTLAYLFNLTTGAGSTIAIAAGHPGMVSLNAIMVAILNVILTVALAPLFGIWGVVGGTVLALVVGSIVFNYKVLRLFEVPWSEFLASILPSGALAFGLAIPPAALAIVVGVPSDRWTALLLFSISLAIYVIPYWILATRFDLLPEKLTLRAARRPPGSSSQQPAS
jgi:O-antigen/teichoic acid export membrane protein